jgi:maltose/moltooligosaccharide transporter
VLGFLVTNLFGGAPIYAMVIAAASFVLAAAATLFVTDGQAEVTAALHAGQA